MSIFQKIAGDIFSKDLPDPTDPASSTSRPESAVNFWDLKYLYHHGIPEIPEPIPTFPFPEPQPDPSPIDFSNQSFMPDLFFSSGDPSPQPSINYFDDVSQNIELVGDLSLINSFDVFG